MMTRMPLGEDLVSTCDRCATELDTATRIAVEAFATARHAGYEMTDAGWFCRGCRLETKTKPATADLKPKGHAPRSRAYYRSHD